MTRAQPLADRLRPQTLDAFVGQQHLVGPGKPLRRMAESGQLRSLIFWGPPGVGKTTLARLLAQAAGRPYVELSAVNAGKAELRDVVARATARPAQDLFSALDDNTATNAGRGTVLFLDEIHRFNKAQQDFLLPHVEDGTLVLIGATTENPSFEVIPALLSRAQVYVLHPLSADELGGIVAQGLAALGATLDDDAAAFLVGFADGDARQALNVLEAAVGLYGRHLTRAHVQDALQTRVARYDKGAEAHYDTISAFIKSMRASDPDAALYYLARMITGGEDPKFIARRMVIFASEDVGLADVHALSIASAVFDAVERVGLPEAQINLAHGAAYLARAPKSRASYNAYFAALDVARQRGNLPVPLHLRNAPTALLKELGYGQARSKGAGNLPSELADTYFLDDDGLPPVGATRGQTESSPPAPPPSPAAPAPAMDDASG